MSDTRVTIESASLPVGPASSIAYLDISNGKLRLVNGNSSRFIVRQVNNNVDISVQLSNNALLPQIIPRVTSIIPLGSSYRIIGTGRTNSTIRINGVNTPVLIDGTFSLVAPLYQGVNSITQESIDDSTITNSIYLIEGGDSINPVIVTSITDNYDGTYTISGTGTPNSIITIAGIDVMIGEDGYFSIGGIHLDQGINTITSNGNTVGTIYIDDANVVIVASITDNYDGTYTISGTGTPSSTIMIAGISVIIDEDGRFSASNIPLTIGTNVITSNGNTVGSIYIRDIINYVIVTSIVENSDGSYTILGTGPAELELMIDDNTTIIEENGNFSFNNIALNDGLTNITSNGNTVGSVYIRDRIDNYVIVDDVTNNDDGTYTINGTSSYDSITISGVEVDVINGEFSAINIPLTTGSNAITSDGIIVGSIFVEESTTTESIEVTEIISNDDGTYTINGTGIPNSTITIANIDVEVDEDGEFSASNIPLTTGLNEITNVDDQVVGSIFVQDNLNLVIVTDVIRTGNSYTVSGTGPPNLDIIIGTSNITISEDGTFSSPNTELSTGINLITSAGLTIGSIYVEESDQNVSVLITSLYKSVDGDYTVEGTGPPDITININEQPVTIDNQGIFISNVVLDEGINMITYDGNNVGYIFLNSDMNSLVVIDDVTNIEVNRYSISGTAPPSSTITINEAELQVNSDGEFNTIDDEYVTLNQGFNPILDQSGTAISGIYINNIEPSLAIITSIINYDNLTLLVVGTSDREGDTVTINNAYSGTINDGRFSIEMRLNIGVNYLTYSDGTVAGYIYYTGYGATIITITIQDRNEDGTYNIVGYTTQRSMELSINGVSGTSDRDSGLYILNNVPLNSGPNYIIHNTDNIGVILLEYEPESITVDGVTSNGDNYDITGTALSDEVTIAGTTVTTNEGNYTFADIPLSEGFNQISSGSSTTGIYLQSSGLSINVMVTNITLNNDGTYTIIGQGPDGLTVTINGESDTITEGEFSITTSLNDGINPILDNEGNTITSFYVSIPNTDIIEDLVITEYNEEGSISGIGGPANGTVSIMNSDITATINNNGTWQLSYDPDSAPSSILLLFTDVNGRQSPPVILESIATIGGELNIMYSVNSGDYIITGESGTSLPNMDYDIIVGNDIVGTTTSNSVGAINVAVNPNVAIPGGAHIRLVYSNTDIELGSVQPPRIIFDVQSVDNGRYSISSPAGTINPSSNVIIRNGSNMIGAFTSEPDGSISIVMNAIHSTNILTITNFDGIIYGPVIVPPSGLFDVEYDAGLDEYIIIGEAGSVPADTLITLYSGSTELPGSSSMSNPDGSVTINTPGITTGGSLSYSAVVGSGTDRYGNVVFPLKTINLTRLEDGSYRLIGEGPYNTMYRLTTSIPIIGGIGRYGIIDINIPEYAAIPGESFDVIISSAIVATIMVPSPNDGEAIIVYIEDTDEYRIISGNNTVNSSLGTLVIATVDEESYSGIATPSGSYDISFDASNVPQDTLVMITSIGYTEGLLTPPKTVPME